MKQNDYMNRSIIMQTADDKLAFYICRAAYHLDRADRWQRSSYVVPDGPGMARLYRQLCQADLAAARYLIDDLADLELIDGPDWQTINNWLVWFGFPAEVR